MRTFLICAYACAFSLLAGCFETTKPPSVVKESVNIPEAVLTPCTQDIPKLATGAEEDVLAFIKDFTSLYKECRSKHLQATGLLCKALTCQKPKE